MKAAPFRFLTSLALGLLVLQGCTCGDEVPEPSPASIASFTATPDTVVAGEEVTLAWETADAVSLALATDAGESVDVSAADVAAGSVTVTPAVTTTYTLTAQGEAGTEPVTQDVAVTVHPVVEVVSFTVDPAGPAAAGTEFSLLWNVAGAETVVVTDEAGTELTTSVEATGSLAVTPEVTAVYTLTATGPGGSAEAQVTAQVSPAIVAFTATPDAILDGDTVVFAWETEAALAGELTGPGGFAYAIPAANVADGSYEVALSDAGDYVLTVASGDLEATQTVSVRLLVPPVVSALTVTPDTVTADAANPATVTVAWTADNASELALTTDTLGDVDLSGVTGDSVDVQVTATTVFTLTATNDDGTDEATATVTALPLPVIDVFAADPDALGPGQATALNWETTGATEIALTKNGAPLPVDAAMVDGTLSDVVTEDATYVLTARTATGFEVTATASVIVAAPVISGFTASASPITVGDSVELTWAVTEDAVGNPPVVELTDDQGNTYDVSAVDPMAGTLTVTPAAAGTYVFTLTATTLGSVTATVTVEVVPAPQALTLTATPEVLDTAAGITSSDIAWTTQDAVSVSLWELDDTGAEITEVFTSTDAAEVAGHQVAVTPAASTTYRLVAANAAGATASLEVTVLVDPLELRSFTASDGTTTTSDALDVLVGADVTLAWDTVGADEVTIQTAAAFTPVAGGYADISGSATATQLSPVNISDGSTPDMDYGFAPVTLPFAFPAYGSSYTEVAVLTDGSVLVDPFTTGIVSAAAFAGDLDGSATGALWADTGTDAQGRQYAVFQWTQFGIWSSTGTHGDLSFQVVLRDDGTLSYHYGTMTDAGDQTAADGAAGAIGIFGPDSRYVVSMHGQAVAGGLTGQGWDLDPRLADQGTLSTVAGYAGEDVFTLTVAGSTGTLTDTVTVRAWTDLTNTDFRLTADPTTTQVGDAVALSWMVKGATEAYVADVATGQQLGTCSATGTDLWLSGSCDWVPSAPGTYELVVVASNPLSSGTSGTLATVTVNPRLAIDSFEAAPEFIASGETATLSWTAEGADGGDITTAAGDPVLFLDASTFAGGTLAVSPTVTTTYVLAVDDTTTGRNEIAEVTVYVDAADVVSFGASATQVPAGGGSVTLTWDTENADAVTVGPGFEPVVALDPATDGFIDISTTGTPITLGGGDDATPLFFPPMFVFPYYGVDRTAVMVADDGYLSFDLTDTGDYSNSGLPGTDAPAAIIAPFWDDLDPGSAYMQYFPGQNGEPDYLVIQWSGYGFYNDPGDLNFQVVLFADGTFDLRYGNMLHGDTAKAAGSSATLGYQDDAAANGHQLSYNTEIAGGLSDTGWHVTPAAPADGSLTVDVTETTTYEVCATGGGYTDCEQVTVVVIEPGVVMVSEFIADTEVAGDSNGEWIELYNTTAGDIDLTGWTLADDGSNSHVIDPAGGVTVVPAGGYLVLGRSADTAINGGYTPDYVYGSDYTLANGDDEIVLLDGTTEIDRVTYDEGLGYDLPAGYAKSADPRFLTGDPAANDPYGVFCNAVDPFGDAGQYGTPGAANPQCQGTVHTFTSTPGLAIPDGAHPTGVTDVLAVSVSDCVPVGISIDVDITHTWIGDLLVTVTNPGATEVVLHANSGGNGQDIVGSYPGTLMPAEPLDGLLQGTPSGDWTMFVSDSANQDEGTLNSWSINLECL